MREFISPEIKSYTSEEILEMIGPAETQYAQTVTGSLPEDTFCRYDMWSFSAEGGTNITATGTPASTLDIGLWAVDYSDFDPEIFFVDSNGPGGPETGSGVIPSTGTWGIAVITDDGSGSYTLTVSSDRPLSTLTLVTDNESCPD